MARHYHAYRQWRRPDFSKMLNKEDKARMEYNKDMAFRSFVLTWNTDVPELLGWSLADFYDAYKNNGRQLTLALDLQ